MNLVDKVKPKYLEEMFSILSSIRTFPAGLHHHKQAIGLKLQSLTKVWPTSRFYVQCKKQLNRLLKSWNIKVEFSKGNAKSSPAPVSNGNGEVQAEPDEDTTSPKKKKKKKKNKARARSLSESRSPISSEAEEVYVKKSKKRKASPSLSPSPAKRSVGSPSSSPRRARESLSPQPKKRDREKASEESFEEGELSEEELEKKRMLLLKQLQEDD